LWGDWEEVVEHSVYGSISKAEMRKSLAGFNKGRHLIKMCGMEEEFILVSIDVVGM
jgi:hypothetical protein